MLALLLIGLRFGGRRLAVLLAFAWTAYPFTAYTLDANTNDAIMPAFLLLGFWLVTSDWARGASVALAGWTKFGALLVAPLWATYPTYELRRVLRFAAAFVVATVLAFAILLLEPSLVGGASDVLGPDDRVPVRARLAVLDLGLGPVPRRRGSRTSASCNRSSRRSPSRSQRSWRSFPRRKGPIELAALTAAVLVAFQLTLTHWFYLYLPWVVPFVFLWLLLPEPEPQETRTRTASIEEALPVSASHSTSAPSMRTPP